MIRLDIKSELPTAIKWTNEHTKQLPYSIANALNTTVQGSKFVAGSKQRSILTELANSSKRYLEKPKAPIQKGWRATRAKKRDLQTTILPKDKGWSRARYLAGSAVGGNRSIPKPWEVKFRNHPKARNMPKGVNFVPTKAAHTAKLIDSAGSLKKSKVNVLYSSVGNTGRTGSNIFIGTPRTPPNRPPGIYRRERREQLRALFIAKSNVSYGSIFPVERVIGQTVQRNFGIELRKELAKNVAKEVKKGTADKRTGFF